MIPAQGNSRGSFFRLLSYVRPYVALVLIAMLCALVFAGMRSARAYLVKPVTELAQAAQPVTGLNPLSILPFGKAEEHEVIPEATQTPRAQQQVPEATLRQQLRRILWFGFWIVLLSSLAHFGKDYLIEYVLGRVLVAIQQDVCSKLLVLPLSFHNQQTRGDTLSRTLNDVGRAHRTLSLLFGDVLQALLSILVGATVLLFISWQLTLITLTAAPLVLVVITYFGRRVRKSAKRRQESLANVTQRLMQILSGIKVIKAYRAEEGEAAAFHQENLRFFRRSMKVIKNRIASRVSTEFVNNLYGIAILALGLSLLIAGRWSINLGDLVAFVTVMMSTYHPFKTLTKGWNELMDALPSAERFFELLDRPASKADVSDAIRLDRFHDCVEFKNVSFSYGREAVLKDISFRIEAGEVVALVGRTGAGKTTIADLLLRLYEPESGNITIDGHPITQITKDSLLSQVGVVTQSPFLFSGNIRDNIRYGNPSASGEEIAEAAGAAHVDEFVRELPHGYDTEVGEEGTQLSGGQRQRITIARAMVRNPNLLILDEATSSLDAKSERYIQASMENLLQQRSVLVIAHRLSTIRHADKIIVLDGGKISAMGRHEELLRESTLYRELVSLQEQSNEAIASSSN